MIDIYYVYEDRCFAIATAKVLRSFLAREVRLISLSGPFDLSPKENIVLFIWSKNCGYTQIRDLVIEFARDRKFGIKREMVQYINLKSNIDPFLTYLDKSNAVELSKTEFIFDYLKKLENDNNIFSPIEIDQNEELYSLIVGSYNHPIDIERYKRFLCHIIGFI